jgi:hypothetical protein
MSTDDSQTDGIDWTLTTWEGARREQMRRWGQMPLADMILALEEMQGKRSNYHALSMSATV